MKGFLPGKNPLKEYSISSSAPLNRLHEIATSLPKLLLTGRVPRTIKSLKKNELSIEELLVKKSKRDLKLAMVQLSFIAHSFVWGGRKPKERLPEVIAKPWVQVARFLGRPPVLSYASYCLDNWFLLEKEPISLENVGLINNFLGGVDEDWFVTVHVCIEHAAAEAVEAAEALSQCNSDTKEKEIKSLLIKIHKSLVEVIEIFSRMTERCDPYIYYHRVRPFIFGSKDNPDLKSGLIFENQFENTAQFYRGETGAQSSIVPSLDGALGIQHSNDTLRHYLNEMREYMPPNHRRFIEKLESSSQIRGLINQSAKLKDSYNNCLEQLTNFRSLHLKYAGMYIHQQSQQKNPFGRGGSTIRGTGGTPFMSYLKKHHDETRKHKK
ncbi:MAG: indoleamine 2,3-dioxygenase [SAR86 cluster bacterium]|nr:indoleamine 2,3-dioxygenase [SAR86 cluster bacterium]